MTRLKQRSHAIAALPLIQYIHDIATKAVLDLPALMRSEAGTVKIYVENFADIETLNSLRMTDKYDLLGLYRGTPLPVKSVFLGIDLEDSIFLYRCPLVRYAYENNESIDTLIKHVVTHELGYHFGHNRYDKDENKNSPHID